MKSRFKITVIIISAVIALLAWAPWITEGFAINKVIQVNPTSSARFMDIDGIPGITKGDVAGVGWLPFGKFVSNVEGGYFITFWGGIY